MGSPAATAATTEALSSGDSRQQALSSCAVAKLFLEQHRH
jgi:hypothetical protein